MTDDIANEHPDRPGPKVAGPEMKVELGKGTGVEIEVEGGQVRIVTDSPVDDSGGSPSGGKKSPEAAAELVPLETDADGQCVPGYEPKGFHPTRGPMMAKRSERS